VASFTTDRQFQERRRLKTIFCIANRVHSTGVAIKTLVENPAFPFKLAFIVLAGINALYFELVIAKRAPVRENHAILPVSVKRAGYASLVLWTLVIICGRLIPYMPPTG